MYQPHPSRELNLHFGNRPFQGVEPVAAKFLFVGLDANYDPHIERSEIFPSVLEYHEDGVMFWRRYGVHHPFLLPQYTGDGRRYHRNFARIGFLPKDAAIVSFVELLHVPTVGRSKLTTSDLNIAHLRWLNVAILGGSAKHVFISPGVGRLMRDIEAFSWLPATAEKGPGLPVLYRAPDRIVYSCLHFSNYGKFQRQMDAEAIAIASILRAIA